ENDKYQFDSILKRQLPKPGQKDLRHFEWHYWNRMSQPEKEVKLENPPPNFEGRFSPDGTTVAELARADGQFVVKIWDTVTGKLRVVCPGASVDQDPPKKKSLNKLQMEFSTDGKRLVAHISRKGLALDGTGKVEANEFWVWDAATGKRLWYHYGEKG